MAGGKLTPRQKMINLMYLVFIAMLALNMSKEVLTAFGLMNEKFEGVNTFSEEYNTSLLVTLEQKAEDDPTRFKGPFDKANQVKTISKELYDYLGSVKNDVSKEFDREENGKLPYEAMDKGGYIDENWFEGDRYSAKGNEIIAKIEKYKKDVIAVFGNDVKYQIIVSKINEKFNLGDVKDQEGVRKKYLSYHFEGFPAIASIAKLTSMQNDVQATEQDIYNALIGNTIAQAASLKNFQAMVILDKNVYFEGETVKGKVVLGKYDANTVPTSFSGPGKIENGQAVIAMKAGGIGEKNITGTFSFMEDGKPVPLKFEGKYVVVPRPKSATISSDNMKVIYKGVNNPMSISFSGIADNNVLVNAPGIKKIGNNGQYIWNIGDFNGKEAYVSVVAKLPDGKLISDKQKFRVKDIPFASSLINGKSGTTIGSKAEISSATIGADFGDFGKDYNVTGSVRSFNAVIGKSEYTCQGNSLSSSAINAIKNLGKNDLILINQLKIVTSSGVLVKNAFSCSFKINN